jgi:outer membrane protein
MRATIFLLFAFSFLLNKSIAQVDTLEVSLEEIVALAQSDAPDALAAAMQMKNRYWAYKSILANYKPGLFFSGQLPTLNRSIGFQPLPDGSTAFIQQSNLRNSGSLYLSQNISKTGGRIYAGSKLERKDELIPNLPNTKSYFSTPFYLGFEQPLWGYNRFKWDKKIEPLKYQEATREFAEQMEKVGYDASALFFDILIAQLNLRSSLRDKANADTLFNISKGRFEVGRIAETELLQIELSTMNAGAAVQRALLALQTGNERLRNFLGLKKSVFFKLETPENIPNITIQTSDALQYATQNRSDVIRFERTLAEADSDVENAKAQRGFSMNIEGQVGFSKSADLLNESYKSPEDNEYLGVSIQVPILNWGRNEAMLETAFTQRELSRMNVEQQRVQFEQEIILKVKQFDLLRNQVDLSKRAYDVAIKREQMTRNRYYIGKIDVLDLGVAVNEKESARVGYVNALQAFWLAYYDLRQSTLYDFERNVSLVRKLEGY